MCSGWGKCAGRAEPFDREMDEETPSEGLPKESLDEGESA